MPFAAHQLSPLVHILDSSFYARQELDLLVDMKTVSNQGAAESPHIETTKVRLSKENLQIVCRVQIGIYLSEAVPSQTQLSRINTETDLRHRYLGA